MPLARQTLLLPCLWLGKPCSLAMVFQGSRWQASRSGGLLRKSKGAASQEGRMAAAAAAPDKGQDRAGR